MKGVSENCIFMGYKRDIDKLVGLSDVMISDSKREGLPVCIMEAMEEYVIKLYRNKGLRIEMGLYGRKMIENGYCTEAINFNYYPVIKS